MKKFDNGATTYLIEKRPQEIKSVKQRFNHMNFTIYKELYSEYVTVKIVCDKTSEIVFQRNLIDEDCFEFLNDEAYEKVLEHTEKYATHVDKMYSILLDWNF
ncbi:hypothetical protein [Macrococcoides canis]|uniref:hypothetical protein n=1 Tax=Macrococcoides canis TaxID=1855823 RepID=UPI00165E5438|nr:hypothetical protein [Macrococcus canis]QNR08260.1 hypothetical protein GL258_08305 [Macrococcus canis]